MQNLNLYEFRDKHSEKEIENIYPISERAFSLMNRNSEKIKTNDGALNIIGILDILEALDYHYSNFLTIKGTEKHNNQKHEIVAYLNRIGQLHYLIKSKFIKTLIPTAEEIIPKVNELIVFRMKNTAHRSIDYPKNESEEYQNRQAFALLGIQTLLFLGKQQYILPTESENKTVWNYFTPEDDHEIVMSQTYMLLKEIVKNIT